MGTNRHSHPADDGIVIVGGGLAAQRCAETLRRSGCEQPIRILCAEPHRPYDRPPLSKALLADERGADELAYRDVSWYEAHDVELHCGVAATGLSPWEHLLHLPGDRRLRYRQLLIATGGRPRTLEALAGYRNAHTLRTVDDALALRDRLTAGTRLAIIGGGFVGLEVAATARKLGADVTVIEAATAPLAQVLGPRVGNWFAELHRSHGVAVVTGRTIRRVEQHDGSARLLLLDGGTAVPTDEILVGVGTEPDVGWLAASGLDIRGGVRVDPHGRTVAPDVYAAGDAAATFDVASGVYRTGSHWEAAARQAAGVARLMLGLEPGEQQPASFWTDQYGLRIQYVGRAGLDDGVEIDGDPASRDFTATYSRDGRVTAVLLVDRPRSLPAARALIQEGSPCHI